MADTPGTISSFSGSPGILKQFSIVSCKEYLLIIEIYPLSLAAQRISESNQT